MSRNAALASLRNWKRQQVRLDARDKARAAPRASPPRPGTFIDCGADSPTAQGMRAAFAAAGQ